MWKLGPTVKLRFYSHSFKTKTKTENHKLKGGGVFVLVFVTLGNPYHVRFCVFRD